MIIINEDDEIWRAIETGGHVIDVIRIIKALDKAGYYIIDNNVLRMISNGEMIGGMKAKNK